MGRVDYRFGSLVGRFRVNSIRKLRFKHTLISGIYGIIDNSKLMNQSSHINKNQNYLKKLCSLIPPNLVNLTLILTLICSACSSTKHLSEGELLYTKTNIHFENSVKINKEKQVISDLSEMARPVPNAKLKLGFYNLMGTKIKKGLRGWLRKKLGEPPVIYDDMQIERTRLRMTKYLTDNGYFGAKVVVDTIVKKRKLEADYRIFSKGQYTIRKVIWDSDSTELERTLREFSKETLLKNGQYYNQINLNGERAKLAAIANDHGYPDFNAEHIYYFVDTTAGNLMADIFLKIKPPNDSTGHQYYFLKNAYVFPEYDLNLANITFQDTILKKEGLYIIQNHEILRKNVIDRAVSQEKGDVFSKKFQDITVNHLLDLGVFRFVNLKYVRRKIGNQNILDRYIYLTPDGIIDVTGELELNNRTGNYLGTAATVTYTHKNLFHGAERLNISVTGGLESQIGSGISFINSADLNVQAGISAPKFLVPFKIKKPSRFYVPRTELKTGVTFQKRIDFYTVNSLQFQFGYNWRETRRVRHELYPISINRLRLTDRQPAFDTLLMNDLRLERSFDDVFIAGVKYAYILSNQEPDSRKDFFFFRVDIKNSENLFVLFTNEIGGLPVSQFFKFNSDFRYNFVFRKTRLATRFLLGTGLAYGKSDVLPYSEQFFIGGSNSVRAFRLRGLGPGRFIDDTLDNDAIENQFIDQTGDIRLEWNVEYRFPIFSYLKGGIFVDAGNIWLIKSDDRPEGVFNFNRFYREIAIGTGFGFRLDFNYFVIRLDAAFALRKPFLNEGFQWTFDQIKFRKRDWRKESLIWNIGIGYPF